MIEQKFLPGFEIILNSLSNGFVLSHYDLNQV